MNKAMYTYAVFVPGDDEDYDEIDVYADTRDEADRLARAEADRFYGKRSRLEPMEPGGSAGLICFL